MNEIQLEISKVIKMIDDEVRIDDDVSGGYLEEPFDKIVTKLYQIQEILSERLQPENNSNNDGKIMRYKIKLIRVFELDENIIRERCSEYGMEPTEENMKQCAEEIARGWYGFNADSKDSVGAEVEKIE